MAKNPPKRGKSVRNGNAPAPYSKYDKKPFRYGKDGPDVAAQKVARNKTRGRRGV